ncbi:hypothetical protein M758_3G025100 [Ceratodon purpureus]|nr:hypothetical protein M758_3G025100 [Ceratodon purpureus]
MGAADGGSARLERNEVERSVVAGAGSGLDCEPGGRGDGVAEAEQAEEARGEEIVLESVRVSEERERSSSALAEAGEASGKDGSVNAGLEEDVDISPNGNSLASLAYMPHDMAARFKNMYVYDNSFSVLPASMRIFKQLRKLKYWANEVKVLPDEIGELTELEEVYLRMPPTGLGSLPPLGKLSGLRALELHQAPVPPSSATLTRDIAQLQSLTRLSVCHFSISWIPAEIGSLKNLEELDLSFNKLRALPKEIAGLKALKSLRVASNKLVELPSELSELPNLTSIDVAHNRLTSFDSLGLESMSSLRALNAQFNKLQSVGQIPEWVCCQLEGNDMLEATFYGVEAESISCGDDYQLDWEVSPSEGNALVVKVNEPPCSSAKGSPPNQKVSTNLKSRRGWRKQENQQYKARQDRLNNSRKHRNDDLCASNEEVHVRKSKANLSAEVNELHCVSSSADENIMDLQQSSVSECAVGDTGRDGCGDMTRDSIPAKQEPNSRIHSEKGGCYNESGLNSGKLGGGKADSLVGLKDEGYHSDVDRRNLKDKNRSRKTISGDRSSANNDDNSSVDCQGGIGKGIDAGATVNSVGVKDGERLRRSGSDTEENPHPSKRRRSRPDFSEISYKYYSESFCGFNERLPDGFYDAGRDRPFSSLEDLEKEQPSFNSREVILVDRKRDEDLHDIALSAEQLLGRLGSTLPKSGEKEIKRSVTMDTFQRITMLALFVSDCFGGSDKTQNVRNMRRSAFGGTAGSPFVCSCSSSLSSGNSNAFADNGSGLPPGTALPSVHLLCEAAVKHMKAQRGSNVLPLGSLRFGVCRHRAILLKYLCDRADPVIPCELVRGYLDYMPHAWNVILVEDNKSSVRVLVDGCRPLDIRHESDPEYFCRYIPLKRLLFPSASVGDQLFSSNSIPTPILFEEIGQGASGASVRRCRFGELTAAAKVRHLDGVGEGLSGKGPESSCLSELRILCSLGKHPCIVSLYGHHFVSQLDSGSQLIIYMEHVKGGSLEGVIKDLATKGKKFMSPRLACQVARNVACALGMLHSKGILHRDVKSSNVLVDLDSKQGPDEGPIVKLCDFDSAVPLSSSAAHTCYLAHRGVPPVDVCVGTPRWIAPEVLQAMYERHAYGLEADVWSFGCLVAELLTLRVPYAGFLESEVHSSIRMGQRPRLSAELENLIAQPFSDKQPVNDDTEILRVLVELFHSCTKAIPSQRPTMKEIFEKLSEVSRPTSTSVDPPFQEEAADKSSNVEATKPVILKPLVARLAEGTASDEAELPCSCGGKKCSQCESNSVPEAKST